VSDALVRRQIEFEVDLFIIDPNLARRYELLYDRMKFCWLLVGIFVAAATVG
jgi:hypothetical protein